MSTPREDRPRLVTEGDQKSCAALSHKHSGYGAEAAILEAFDAKIVDTDDIGAYAIEYAVRGWRVFPLRGKAPAIRSAHPDGDPLRGKCKGDCGREGHGCLDATNDLDVVARWWSGPWKGANIGVVPPPPVMVIDVDPRNGGTDSLARLTRAHGGFPDTLRSVSGRGDGGHHMWLRRPEGKITAKNLGRGIDVKTSAGYVVAPPSVHPDTGMRYFWLDPDALVADPPEWLVDLVRPLQAVSTSKGQKGIRDRTSSLLLGPSVADDFTEATTWGDVLEPAGWRCLDPHGDDDGARWLHPAATSDCSATVRHDCLFVYSDNTPFEPTTAGDPHGYTRFRAWAVLNHGGDLSAAARSFSETGAL